MRKMAIALAIICGSAFGGEEASLDATIKFAINQAYIIADDSKILCHKEIAAGQEITRTIELYDKINNAGISLYPSTAENIAKECEPYIALFNRGRKFNDDIKIDDSISVSINFSDSLTLNIKNAVGGVDIMLGNDRALIFVKHMLNAIKVSNGWNAAFVSLYPQKIISGQSAKSESSKDAAIDLADISNAYSVNEFSGDKEYSAFIGKPITIVGTVRTVRRNPFTKKPAILFQQSVKFIPISCELDSEDDLASLQEGQRVKVTGIWMGKPKLMDATITKAVIIER